ncbi:nucleoside hydrolase [Lichenicola cladoniae]|uniref:Nucleoside hydrolase n=1 Tax=Lichenicola cladoniae TaxID=1484109 RepID=A0A6M8HV94_9PROT|nr:nucleoside hydrolase [Lichenicola cladoniae]NPD69386.1 nucleoside hydrolase [Acetobacteraceae bacterium]QKE92230.1 nucleoside hydrolase [Lichenicola cladoniae]
MRKVIFDTDPGVDDAMALRFLTRRPELDLLGVTTVHGNADIDTVTRNALFLKDRFGFPAPVSQGSGVTLLNRQGSPAGHVHGSNGLGDIDIPDTIRSTVDLRRGHRFIIDLIRANPHEITIIAVGPLTNLARALDKDREIARLVQGVVVMGGAFGMHGHTGNVSPVAEANISNDPEAADVVFTAPWPVTIIGLDVTQQVVMDAAYLERLRRDGGEDGQFLWDLSRGYQAFHQRTRRLDGIFTHDSLAVAYAVAPELFTIRRGPVRVVCGGLASGQTIQKPKQSPFPVGAWDAHPEQSVAVDVDVAGVLALYAGTFIPAGPVQAHR